jgi:type I restriction enzyme R subunit
MPYDYSEDILVEQTAIELLKELGWETVLAFDAETFGKDGMLGRNGKKEVVLQKFLFQALKDLNPDLPNEAYQQAIDKLIEYSSSKLLADINYEKYEWLTNGIPVDYRTNTGEQIKDYKLRVFDFDEAKNNHFIAVRQLWVEGNYGHKRRPDIIGFVNGIPLLFIELKATHRNLETAHIHNLKDYKDTIPQLFHCNAFVILSNGIDSKIGSITGKYEHFHDWKRIQENEEGIVSMETILRGVCDRTRFIDLFENYILYDTKTMGSVVKLIARNHQFIGVNLAIDNFRTKQLQHKEGIITQEESQKLGVFWHTQGSGKSYSMVFFCQKIHRKFTGNYSFLIVTDRNELDTQIYGTFSGVGVVPSTESGKKSTFSAKADSGSNLKQLLKEDKRYIFSLIHKFNFEDVCTERSNLIVISDEAHRTQAGTYAMNMRKALPHASFLGFTGTPLFKNDEITKRIFGEYISTYNFKRSVDDGATVPLYYENRGELLQLENPDITQQMRDAIAKADLDADEEAKLEYLFSKEYPVLTAKHRLQKIAHDLVQHFCKRGYKGKAMYVALDKVTAVKMYNHITEAWKNYVIKVEREITKLNDDQEQISRQQELNWIKETEICVVVSNEQNEVDKFKKWDLDILPHREKMVSRDLETDFKDEDHPFRIAIVCAMWITGFDVPSLSTLYIDKPLKAHTLMQTIARANRINEGKNNGLIVDYIDTYRHLLDALAVYAIGGGDDDNTGGEPIVKPSEELIIELEEAISSLENYMKEELGFDLDRIISTDGLLKLRAIQDGEDAIYVNEETKKRFEVQARLVFKKQLAVGFDAIGLTEIRKRKDAIQALYDRIQRNTKEADVSALMKTLQDIVDDSVVMELDTSYSNGNVIDISHLDFELIKRLYEKSAHKNTAVANLKEQIEKRLLQMIKQNPSRIDFYIRYQEIITEYNEGKDRERLEQVFQELVKLVEGLNGEEQRVKREGLTEEQGAIFDLLLKPQLNEKDKNKVRSIAIELLETLKNETLQVENWADKNATSSTIRKVISMYLFENLPEPYSEVDVDEKTQTLFYHLRNSYFGNGISIY